MKQYIIILISLLVATADAYSQDDELNRLTDIVMSLKSGGETAYNAAIKSLAADRLWTPMDELGINRDTECRVSDRVAGFRLNSILNNAENAQRYQTTTGNHLNGADSRYNYSLYEKTLKAGKTATFSLPGRYGDQIFVIIPFQGAKAAIKANATSQGTTFAESALGNGAIRLTGKAVKGQPVILTVTNGSKDNISYVILNYNSRR